MRYVLIFINIWLIAGCKSNITRSTLSGDFYTLAEQGQQQPYLLSFPTNELWAYCQSFVKSHVFTPVDDYFTEITNNLRLPITHCCIWCRVGLTRNLSPLVTTDKA